MFTCRPRVLRRPADDKTECRLPAPFQVRVRFLQIVDAGPHCGQLRKMDTPNSSGCDDAVAVDRARNLEGVEGPVRTRPKDSENLFLERHVVFLPKRRTRGQLTPNF